jgi:uncharacterized delta-60 repeat protein
MRPPTDQSSFILEPLESRQLLSAGQLDPTFGHAGKLVTNLGLGFGNGVAIQADGKIVASATGDDFTGFHLVRYNPDGSLDPSFGAGGVVTTDLGRHDFTSVQALILQPDGKILLGGTSQVHSGSTFTVYTVLARYNPDGRLDATFGDHGVLRLPGDTYPLDGSTHGTFSPGPVILATQADGGILVTQILGDDYTTRGADLVLYRLTATGQADPTFGRRGRTVIDLGVIERPTGMAVQADGKILLSIDGYTVLTQGPSTSWPSEKTFLVRLNADGSRDASFGTGGVVTENAPRWQINADRIAVGLDGKILLLAEEMGRDRSVNTMLIRYDPAGARDRTVDGDGERVLNAGEGGSFADLLVQPDGKLLLTGTTSGGRNGKPGFLSQRLNPDGTPDAGYGDGGSTWVGIGDQFDGGSRAALQQDGKVVIVGFTQKDLSEETAPDHQDLALVRLQGDAGASGSRHFSLRRGIDQEGEYTGRPSHHHRSPKRRAMEEAAKARAAALATVATSAIISNSAFNTASLIQRDDNAIFSRQETD